LFCKARPRPEFLNISGALGSLKIIVNNGDFLPKIIAVLGAFRHNSLRAAFEFGLFSKRSILNCCNLFEVSVLLHYR
jgi:hypothetical protein